MKIKPKQKSGAEKRIEHWKTKYQELLKQYKELKRDYRRMGTQLGRATQALPDALEDGGRTREEAMWAEYDRIMGE